MNAEGIFAIQELIIAVIVIAMIILLVNGMINLIRYFRTRERSHLITGLICTLIVPGLIFCALVVYVLPNAFIMYAPPPSNYTP